MKCSRGVSAYSAPAYAGIPITHRGKASSFHVITGHEDPAKGEVRWTMMFWPEKKEPLSF